MGQHKVISQKTKPSRGYTTLFANWKKLTLIVDRCGYITIVKGTAGNGMMHWGENEVQSTAAKLGHLRQMTAVAHSVRQPRASITETIQHASFWLRQSFGYVPLRKVKSDQRLRSTVAVSSILMAAGLLVGMVQNTPQKAVSKPVFVKAESNHIWNPSRTPTINVSTSRAAVAPFILPEPSYTNLADEGHKNTVTVSPSAQQSPSPGISSTSRSTNSNTSINTNPDRDAIFKRPGSQYRR